MAPYDAEVGLSHLSALERCAQPLSHLGQEPEQEHPRGTPVEAVRRVDPLPDLVAHLLHGELLLRAGEVGAVHQEPGGLVDRNQVRVSEEEGQCGAHAGLVPV
jgi:hypothetical protein